MWLSISVYSDDLSHLVLYSPECATFGQKKKKHKNMLLIEGYILVLNISLLTKHIEKNKSHDFDEFDIIYSQDKKNRSSELATREYPLNIIHLKRK